MWKVVNLARGGMKLLLFLGLFLSFSFYGKGQVVDVRKVLNQVFDKIATVKTLYYSVVFHERVYENGKMRKDSSVTKYQRSPQRVYIKMSSGAEVLWGPDMNDGDVLVHPNSFPYFNLSLNPDGYWMRKNQHHGIDEMGLDYFASLVKAAMNRAGNDFDSHFFYLGELKYNGFQCMQIVVIDPGFKFVPYTVKQGENILTIARSQCLNEYMILKHNPKISSYKDVKAGQVIMIPNNYGVQVKLYIDKNTLLPVMMRVDDEKGLFEEYDYKEIKPNPNFSSDEFTKDYKGYHF